jgi:EAL domain-containing protein (putative c-di-GMP-specific phosphodiesterase class I)/GGDEF domain-containing protein
MARTEQRRYSRLATRLEARVRAGDSVCRVQVRDYCLTGLLAVPAGAADWATVARLGRGQVVELALDGGPVLRAVVARADEAGLGLQVSSLPEEALAVLHAAAVAARATATFADPPNPAAAASASARQAMQRECQQQFAASLNEVLKGFMSELPAALDTAVGMLQGMTLRRVFAGVAHRVHHDRAGIASRFDAALREAMRHPNRRRSAAPLDEMPTALALVDEAQFEEWLSLSAVVQRIESDHSQPLVDLRRRYGVLRVLPLDRVSDPFGPEAIMRAFQKAIEPLDLPTPVRVVVYETFGEALRNQCAALYEALNQVLALLDEPRTARRIVRRAVRPRPGSAGEAGTAGAAAVPVPAGAGAATAATPATASAAATTVPGLAVQAKPHIAARALPSVAAPAARSAASAVSLDTHSLLELVGRLRLESAPPRPADVSRGGAAATDPAPVPADPSALPGLLDALLAAATAPAAGSGPAADLAGPPLSERLTLALEALPIAPAQRRTVESATGLIGRALSEPDADTAIRRLLRRLEAPLLRLALRDPAFLASRIHPGRRLVDLIEQCSIATDDRGRFEDPKLDRLLNRMVERVAAEVGRDPAILERNARVLERLLGPIRAARRHRVERLQHAFEAREGVLAARRRVDAALGARLGGRHVPPAVQTLLECGWVQFMTLAEIRGGASGGTSDRALATLVRLVGALSGERNVAPSEARRAMVSEVEPLLRTIGTEPDRIDACLAGLTTALDAVERQGPVPCGTPLIVLQAEPEDADLAFARRLRIGDWWQLDGEDGTRALQLVWLSTPPRACGFASRSASDRHELTLDAFAREIEAGRMRPCTDRDRPLLERSELDLLDEGWQSLRQRAQCDPVTGLPNRRGFLGALSRTDGTPHPQAGERWIGLVQFDTLRIVGARCGVDAAESLLRVLVAQTREALGPAAQLASHGDDTLAFAIAASDGADGEPAAAALLERLRDYPFEHGEERYRIGVHIGLARFVPGRNAPEEAIGRAESACAAAREQGRNRVQVHERSSRALRSQESLTDWAGRLDRLLEGDGLFLRCQRIQPICGDPALVPYFEVLLGIDSADGPAEPSEFVAAVEGLKRSHELDLWVMRHTLDWIDANPAVFDSIGGFAINVSPRSLDSPEIMGLLHQRLGRLGPDAAKLTFELTESSAIECYGAAQDFIRQVRRYGCRLSLDDFGSGYASYAHLKNLRTDVLKIDGSFVRDIATNPGDLAMVRSMHEVARSLGMRTVAEHVENNEILDMLRAVGIDYVQGWAIHTACRIDALAEASDTLTLDSEPASVAG